MIPSTIFRFITKTRTFTYEGDIVFSKNKSIASENKEQQLEFFNKIGRIGFADRIRFN